MNLKTIMMSERSQISKSVYLNDSTYTEFKKMQTYLYNDQKVKRCLSETRCRKRNDILTKSTYWTTVQEVQTTDLIKILKSDQSLRKSKQLKFVVYKTKRRRRRRNKESQTCVGASARNYPWHRLRPTRQ
jgi:hypothetical protein